jgi:hypothetical protein
MILNITNEDLLLTIEGGQGPAGSNISTYAIRIDQVDSTTIYRGEATAGSLESAASWRIQLLTISGEDITVTWASGNNTFDKVWNDRLTYIYS